MFTGTQTLPIKLNDPKHTLSPLKVEASPAKYITSWEVSRPPFHNSHHCFTTLEADVSTSRFQSRSAVASCLSSIVSAIAGLFHTIFSAIGSILHTM